MTQLNRPPPTTPEPPMTPKRILVIANKAFEADPLVHVLATERGSTREADLGPIACGSHPRLRKRLQRRA